MPEIVGAIQVPAVPGQMFASHPDAGMFPIKPMQSVQVAEHDITQFPIAKLRSFRKRIDELFEFAKDPGAPLSTSSNHQAVSTS